jgi:cytochrome P450
VVNEVDVNSIMDLFAAGSETTSTTLRWALLFMVLNTDVQVCCGVLILLLVY